MAQSGVIYMDNNSTTKPLASLSKYNKSIWSLYGNPSSSHCIGKKAKEAMDLSRRSISDTLGIDPDELVFTSSATEANNLVLRGIVKCKKSKCRIVTSKIEHPSIMHTCGDMAKRKECIVNYISVNKNGLVDLAELENILKAHKVSLVSIIGANNVTGVIQPIKKIAEIVHTYDSVLHVDMTQLVGKIPIHPKELDIDFMTFSGHKFHCVRGVGALYINDEVRDRIHPCITGGGHEHSMRAGTENVGGMIMMAATLQELMADEDAAWDRHDKIGDMRDYIQSELLKNVSGSIVNSSDAPRLKNTLSMCLPRIESNVLVKELNERGICIGIGSACSNITRDKTDHVLTAMGVSKEMQVGTIRISLCGDNTMLECRTVVESIVEICGK